MIDRIDRIDKDSMRFKQFVRMFTPQPFYLEANCPSTRDNADLPTESATRKKEERVLLSVPVTMNFTFEQLLSAGQILFLCFLVCAFLTGKAIWQQSFSQLPPGPWGIPVIGKIFFMSVHFSLC